MIEKITIRNIATFDNTGVVIENIKKLNFFFGHNGSGKSTITKFLRDICITDPNENIFKTLSEGEKNFIAFLYFHQLCLGTDDPMYYIKSAFIGAINDESHGGTPFDSLHYHKITIEQPQILFDVFKSIFENIGVEHYNMMMNITTDEQA